MKPHVRVLDISNHVKFPDTYWNTLFIEFASQYNSMNEAIQNCTSIIDSRGHIHDLRKNLGDLFCLFPIKQRYRHLSNIIRNTPIGDKIVWDLIGDYRVKSALHTVGLWVDGLATDGDLKIANIDVQRVAHTSSRFLLVGMESGIDAVSSIVADTVNWISNPDMTSSASSCILAWISAIPRALNYGGMAFIENQRRDITAAELWQYEYIKTIDWSFCDVEQ